MLVNHYPLKEFARLPRGADVRRRHANRLVRSLERANYVADGTNRCCNRKLFEELCGFRNGQTPEVAVNAHFVWSWDIVFRRGRWWMAALPRHRFLSASPLFRIDPGSLPLAQDEDGWLAIDLESGRRRKVFHDGGAWHAPSGDWRITFSPMALESIGCSAQAADIGRVTFEQIERLVPDAPFADVLECRQPYVPDESDHVAVDPCELQFGNGQAKEMKKVLSLGIHSPPPKRVSIAVVRPQNWATDTWKEERQRLAAQLMNPDHSIRQIWEQRLRIPPFEVAAVEAARYCPETGEIDVHGVEKLQSLVKASQPSAAWVALVLTDGRMSMPAHHALSQNFRETCRCVRIQRSQLHEIASNTDRGFYVRANIAVEVASRAGAIPWVLSGLRDADDALFVGIDLGHDHKANRSVVGITCFDAQGIRVEQRTIPVKQNNEYVIFEEVASQIPRVLRNYGGEYDQVILHRDGRVLENELPELLSLGKSFRSMSVVCVKKDTRTRVSGDMSDRLFVIDREQAILVTNEQGVRNGMPVPLEIEVRHPGRLTIESATSQVYWLTRVYSGSLFQPKRLPITTGQANNICGTGTRAFQRSFHSE